MIRSVNPASPGDVVLEIAPADPAAIESALAAGVVAQPGWSADPMARVRALSALAAAIESRRQEFVDLMVREVGKPGPEAAGEVDRATAILRFYSQIPLDPVGDVMPGSTPGAQVLVERHPLGLILAICPWNFPLAIPLWKSAPALAYGNSVLIKPASPAVATARLLAECAAEVLPDGVLTVLPMGGAAAGELLDDGRIAAVTFTGSTGVGTRVAERMARRAAPAQAEMGGQNAVIVLDDANLDAAADAIVAGAMGFAGQKCTASRRVVALAGICVELESKLAARVGAIAVGDPSADGVTAGPLISEVAAEEFESARMAAIDAGATEIARAIAPDGEGFFVSPSLLRQDDPLAEVNQEETFGPLLTLIEVADEEAAIAAANSTRFGLVGAVHGRDLGRATRVASRMTTGLRRINAPTPGVDYYAPFGGEGHSSFGPREQGRAAREFFTSSTTTTVVPSS
ncbi:MAG: aldehyde dehydrogenase family protein [Solirubrobacterales bacterium]|nr:aldehyde dehydrogenase family protein [Solirubrobacterales bacterium]HMT05916.1 aldehyde dehydrogenase family protein [Solirubrobacterales bacterium]